MGVFIRPSDQKRGSVIPIVAYEFMNQYYVQEGNKRVSVLKYVGAFSITASVTRLIPKENG